MLKRNIVRTMGAVMAWSLMLLGINLQAAESSVTTDLVKLTKSAPAKVAVGETFAVSYTVTARQDLANVVVTDQIPAGAVVDRSEPQGAVQGNQVSWTVDTMSAGDSLLMQLYLTPQQVGSLEGCATVTAEPRACVSVLVGQPELAIVKNGPAQAMLGSTVAYTIQVSNTGSSTATDVVVTDTVPEGMSHASGNRELVHNVGTLEPGQSRNVSVELRADQRGEFCNKASATAGNASAVDASACTLVVDQQLEVVKSGPERQFLGKNAEYSIVISNPGDLDLTNVVVVDTAPDGTQIVSADGARIEGNTATWTIATLAAGAKETRTVVLTSRTVGERCNNVNVATSEGLRGKSSACTLWQGYPALLIEVVDTVDPLQPGDFTTYVITVTNQGTAADENVKIKVSFPAETTPVEATGDTQMTIAGKVVDTAAYPILEPKQVIEWRVRAEAVQAGDSRMKVELTSGLLTQPVTEEESTQVY